jgi:hypothetical protein
MSKRYWFPRYIRDQIDVDYLDKLSAKDRDWMERFIDEYYGATNAGISSAEQIADSDRAKKRASRDLFASGLRADGDQLASVASTPVSVSEELERPEVLAILEELRTLRPGFDDADGRRRARFVSPDAESRFHLLRQKLAVLLERGE